MRRGLLAVVADGLNRAALHRLRAEGDFLVGGGLLADEGNTLVIVTGKEVLSRLAAKVAVDAVAVHVELAGHVLLILLVNISHSVYGAVCSPDYFFTFFAENQSFFIATRDFLRKIGA